MSYRYIFLCGLKSANISNPAPSVGLEGETTKSPITGSPGGINIIKCKKKNNGIPIVNISGSYIGLIVTSKGVIQVHGIFFFIHLFKIFFNLF